MRLAAAVAIITLTATAPAAALERDFDFRAFFTGRTHAENVLKIALKKPVRMVVDTVGRTEGKSFVLIDTVREEGKPTRTRKWVMHQDRLGNFTGTLSDAVGPVEIVVIDDTARIRYTMKGGLKVDQRLQARDARTLSNYVVVKRFGMKFARVDGTIRKLD